MSISNIIINSPHVRDTDAHTLFGNEEVYYTDTTDISVLMKEIGAFESTTKARQAGRAGKVPAGFTDKYKASKKMVLWIWNPSE